MESGQTTARIHPLMAGAAVSLTLVCLLGVAAISGVLPSSHSSTAPQSVSTIQASNSNPAAPVLVQTPNGYQYMQPVTAPVAGYQVQPEAAPARRPQHARRSHTQTYAQADTGYRNDVRQTTYQQPAPQANSPIGIATGAVVGGLLGSQVGGGNGRTLATVAGAVGGGYLGNMAGQRYGY